MFSVKPHLLIISLSILIVFPCTQASNSLFQIKDNIGQVNKLVGGEANQISKINIEALMAIVKKQQETSELCIKGRNSVNFFVRLHFADVFKRLDELHTTLSHIAEKQIQIEELENDNRYLRSKIESTENELSICERNSEEFPPMKQYFQNEHDDDGRVSNLSTISAIPLLEKTSNETTLPERLINASMIFNEENVDSAKVQKKIKKVQSIE